MPLWDDTVRSFVAMGGVVMVPLIAVGVLLWYLIVLRWLSIRRGVSGPIAAALRSARVAPASQNGVVGEAVSELVALHAARGLTPSDIEPVIARQRQQIARHGRVILALVAAAPLLGLLGTVSGMIETFHALTEMALVSESGGISGGISEALVTTQMGLAIAIPGMLVARLLEGRARRLHRDLDELAAVAPAALAAPREATP
jgi:biopolymer transport protein ExbB